MASFTPRVRRRLLDELSSNSTLGRIRELFEGHGVPLGPEVHSEGGVRRALTSRYLSGLDLSRPSDRVLLMLVYSDVLNDVAERPEDMFADTHEVEGWYRDLRSAGFEVDRETWTISDPSTPVSAALNPAALAALADPSAIHDHLQRLGGAVDVDPRLAVSAAKALMETTAKHVLTACGQAYPKNPRMPALIAEAQEALGLAAKGAGTEAGELRQILAALATVGNRVTEVRNQVGVDHGTESVPGWVRPRHARLVVGAARVWCEFMLETLGDPSAPWRREATRADFPEG